LTSRDTSKGEAARSRIETTTGRSGIIEVWQLDLASTKSIKAFAERAYRELDRLDVLLENAGSATETFTRVGDDLSAGTGNGTETILAVNVIGTFHLAVLLLPLLKRSGGRKGAIPSRLCILTSDLHFLADEFPQRKCDQILAELDKEDGVRMMFERSDVSLGTCLSVNADVLDRYNISKLIEILIAQHIARLLQPSQSANSEPPVVINTVNSGLVDTDLARDQGNIGQVFKFIFRAWTPEVGARCLVHAAAMGEESHGKHTSNGVIAE